MKDATILKLAGILMGIPVLGSMFMSCLYLGIDGGLTTTILIIMGVLLGVGGLKLQGIVNGKQGRETEGK